MKKLFIAILSVQFVLNVLFSVYAVMVKNEADKAILLAIKNEKEAIRQAKICDLYRIQLDKYKSISIEMQKRAKEQSERNQALQMQILELKFKK